MTEYGGLEKKRQTLEEDIGKYRIFYLPFGLSFQGKLREIKDGLAYLNPYIGIDYDAEKGPIRKFVDNPDEPEKFIKTDVIAVQPTSEQSLRNFCEYSNKHPEKEQKEKEQKEQDEKK